MTWSQAFAAYLKRHKIKPHAAALILDVSPTTVHYWTKGSEPRGERGNALKQRIEVWSNGEVKAAPWTAPESPDLVGDAELHARAS
jgi:hypothetical protein